MTSNDSVARRGGLSPGAFTSMFQSINGLRNRRALLAIVGCMFAGVLWFGLFSFLAVRLGWLMGTLGAFGLFIASAAGVNAAGVLLMEQANGEPSRTLGAAIRHGLACIPRFILLGLALLVAALAVFAVLALAYLVCTIPVLGPLLFVAVFPVSVVVSGLTVCGLLLCMLLALPPIWQGASIRAAITQALTIARSRLVEAILLLAVVWTLSLVVGFIVFGVLFIGLGPMIGMASSVLGNGALGGLSGFVRGGVEIGSGASGSHMVAASVGAGLLWAFAGSLVSLVNLLGLNLVYLRVTEGLDDAATA